MSQRVSHPQEIERALSSYAVNVTVSGVNLGASPAERNSLGPSDTNVTMRRPVALGALMRELWGH
jgi:hypothetical protein